MREAGYARTKKPLTIGIFASLLHLTGDLILGWGLEDETLTGVARMLSVYTGISDAGLLAVALLGLSFFDIYRLMAPYSAKFAHNYRTAIFGYLMFGACGWIAFGSLWMFTGLRILTGRIREKA